MRPVWSTTDDCAGDTRCRNSRTRRRRFRRIRYLTPKEGCLNAKRGAGWGAPLRQPTRLLAADDDVPAGAEAVRPARPAVACVDERRGGREAVVLVVEQHGVVRSGDDVVAL